MRPDPSPTSYSTASHRNVPSSAALLFEYVYVRLVTVTPEKLSTTPSGAVPETFRVSYSLSRRFVRRSTKYMCAAVSFVTQLLAVPEERPLGGREGSKPGADPSPRSRRGPGS